MKVVSLSPRVSLKVDALLLTKFYRRLTADYKSLTLIELTNVIRSITIDGASCNTTLRSGREAWMWPNKQRSRHRVSAVWTGQLDSASPFWERKLITLQLPNSKHSSHSHNAIRMTEEISEQ